jgi:RHS repeat-associated protein
MVNTAVTGWSTFGRSNTDASFEVRFDYVNKDTSDAWYRLMIDLRITSGGERLMLALHPTDARLAKYVGGFWSLVDQNTGATITQDELYHFRAVCDGSSVKVYRWQDGELETEILSGTVTDVATTTTLNFAAQPNSVHAVDNIRILSDDLENSYTFAYNTANELTSMTGPNGTTTFTYDAWGRQTAKTLNSVTDTYAYRYGSKLYGVDLGNDTEVEVAYEYGADGKRRRITTGGLERWVRWNSGWGSTSIDDENGTLLQLMVGTVAAVEGPTPSSGDWTFLTSSHARSITGSYDDAGNKISSVEYEPYGRSYSLEGISSTVGYAGMAESVLGMMFPYRIYGVEQSRWFTRDPLTMIDGPNLYGYVGANPINKYDRYGLSFGIPGKLHISTLCRNLDNYYYVPEESDDKLDKPLEVPLPLPRRGGPPLYMTIKIDAFYGPRGCLKIPNFSSCTIKCDWNGNVMSAKCKAGIIGKPTACGNPDDGDRNWFPPNPNSPDDGSPPGPYDSPPQNDDGSWNL